MKISTIPIPLFIQKFGNKRDAGYFRKFQEADSDFNKLNSELFVSRCYQLHDNKLKVQVCTVFSGTPCQNEVFEHSFL